ncbi:MAG: hypothetical protein QM640_16470 [Niabella sp.]
MDPEKDDFKFVTHSMGSAFAEGIIEYLKDMGWNVTQTVHLEAFQAKDIKASTRPRTKKNKKTLSPIDPGTYVIDYQINGDWVLDLPNGNPGDIEGANKKIRANSSNDLLHIHRDPIDRENPNAFWNSLKSIDPQIKEVLGNFLKQNPNIKIYIQ